MAEIPGAWREVHRTARGAGFVACLIGPLLVLGLAAAGVLAPGGNPVAGVYQQVGYTFTGLVFLAAAWATWRRGRVLKAFGNVPAAARAGILRREALVAASISLTSALWGALYWAMVGWNAVRHALAFLFLTPVMFLCFMPGLQVWTRFQKEAP
ncbi:MAG TPA: hypothetical protein VF804_06160 [Holophagaceae bacterium]